MRASGLRDKELEFFHTRFLEMNYWEKVGIIVFEKAMWGAKCKLLGKREMRGAMGVNTLKKSSKWKFNCSPFLVIFGSFLGDFVQFGFA